MSIDASVEQLISLREAARMLPRRRRGKRPHISCLYRWTTTGCQGVILESVMVGGTRCTSREAVGRFIMCVTDRCRLYPSQRPADAAEMLETQLDIEDL
jgi:hypothetical protein